MREREYIEHVERVERVEHDIRALIRETQELRQRIEALENILNLRESIKNNWPELPAPANPGQCIIYNTSTKVWEWIDK